MKSKQLKLPLLAALIGLSLVPVAGTAAPWADRNAVPAPAPEPAETEPSQWVSAIGVEGFYAKANEEILDGSVFEKVNLGGLSVRWSAANTQRSVIVGALVFPEIYGILSIGGGSSDYRGSYERYDLDMSFAQAALGANLRCFVNDQFSVFGGVRLGFAYENVEIESEDSTYLYKQEESDVGLLYGIGVGAELELAPHHSVTLGIDYVASTAQPDFGDGDKLKKQSYIIFSIGYKYRF